MLSFFIGTNDACRPCRIARRYIGSDESKSPQNIHSDKLLKLIGQGKGQDNHFKVELKMADNDDDNDDGAKLGESEAVKLVGGSQVGTPLPNVELVKELLQSGAALNSDANNQVPLIANDQSLLQKSPALVQTTMIQPQQLVQQQLLQQQQQQQQHQKQQQQNLNGILPQLTSSAMPLSGNQKLIPPLLKSASINPFLINEDASTESLLTLPPVAFNPSSLSQALLGTEKFQRQKAGKAENMHRLSLENGPGSSSPLFGALSTLPVQDSYSTNKIAFSHENAGLTSSLPVVSPPVADVFKATQFQSPMELSQFQFPMDLDSPARKTNWFGFPPAGVANKKSPFEEYKYDFNDKEGNLKDIVLLPRGVRDHMPKI